MRKARDFVKRPVAAIVLLVLFAGCARHQGAPKAVHSAPPAAAQTPFAHLANDMSSDCIRSATDSHVARSTVFLRCSGAYNALLNAKAPQPYADEDAVTASILEIYAAYALREASGRTTERYYAMLRDAGARLRILTKHGTTAQTRERAVAARSCLIERDAACLKEWAHYQ